MTRMFYALVWALAAVVMTILITLPINLQAQLARLLAAFKVGTRAKLELEYAAPPRLTEVRQALEALPGAVDTSDTEQRLLLARAGELALEAQLAELVGQPKFRVLAAQRYPIPEQHAELRRAALERLATPLTAGPEPERLHASDDDQRGAREPARTAWSLDELKS